MSCDPSRNDSILDPYLMEDDSDESEKHLMLLLSEYAEPRIKGIVISRLRAFPNDDERPQDFEDVFSEAKTRLLAYLQDLKGKLADPCTDFLGYVGGIAHIACTDYFRKRYPVRARLYKAIRDCLKGSPEFAVWKIADKRAGEWLAGLAHWQEGELSSESAVTNLRDKREALIATLSSLGDVQTMSTNDLLRATFEHVAGTIRVTDLVDLIAELRGLRDHRPVSLESGEADNWLRISDSRARIDSILEMREALACFWRGLRSLNRKELTAYLLYARDTSGEDIISLLVWARVASEQQIATLLGMTLERFQEISREGLPFDNERIAGELGLKVERVYRLRNDAGKRLDRILAKFRRTGK